MRFSRIRPQAECGLNRRFRQRQPRRSVVGAEEVKQIVRVSQLAVSEEKLRITRYRLVQQINSLQQILSGSGGETCRKNESLGATVEIERCDVRRERLLDRALFTRRKFCLELVGYSLRDLALNCKHVCEIAIIGLRPEVRIVARIDELRRHSYSVSRALNAPFEHVSNAELLPNFAKISRIAAFVEHH